MYCANINILPFLHSRPMHCSQWECIAKCSVIQRANNPQKVPSQVGSRPSSNTRFRYSTTRVSIPSASRTIALVVFAEYSIVTDRQTDGLGVAVLDVSSATKVNISHKATANPTQPVSVVDLN